MRLGLFSTRYHGVQRMIESSKPVFALVLCSDQYMELPLLVAASSATKHIAPNFDVHVYLILSSVGEKGVARIRRTLDRVGRQYSLTILPPPDHALFQSFRPFFGTYTTYYKLVLPDLIPEDRFLYLDTDTVTATDLSPLATIDMQGYPMGFVVQSTMGSALEKKFFLELGHGKDDPALNAGVMLVDAKRWKAQQCSQRLMQFCRKYPDALLSGDQTAFTALFAKSCFPLDDRFNVRLSTVERDELLPEGIYHFVGSPKPWDIFANLFHAYSRFWNGHRKSAGIGRWTLNPYLEPSAWRRLPRIAGALLRCLRWRVGLMLLRRN
jgi:lipopolysaccharide biosynthesis glycosyltransferase